jgi:orotate phosphoribosyltransferase-like protein
MGGPRIHAEVIDAIRRLKEQGRTDLEIATALGISMNQVSYVRSTHGIGGRYAKYKKEINDV